LESVRVGKVLGRFREGDYEAIEPGPGRRSGSPTAPPELEVGIVALRKELNNGKVTLRHQTHPHHIGVGHAHKGKRVVMLVDGLEVRVLSEDGELLRHLTLDSTRGYQPQG
jgi:hypothetical protein